jgi:hypothetical protein
VRPVAVGVDHGLGDGLAVVLLQEAVVAVVGEGIGDLDGALAGVDVEEAIVVGPVVVLAEDEAVATVYAAAQSLHSGLADSISATFLLRRQPLS